MYSNYYRKQDVTGAVIIIIFFSIICLFLVGLRYYRAGLQAEVCKRQGIEMTTWELFMGVKPIERSVIIKKGDKPNEDK